MYFSKNYKVLDFEGNVVFTGDVRHICKKLDITAGNVSKAIRTGQKVRRKYRIVYYNK